MIEHEEFKVKIDVEIQVEIQVEQHTDYMAATVMPFGVTAFAEDLATVLERADQGVQHLLNEYDARGDLWSYLNDCDAQYRVEPGVTKSDVISMRKGLVGEFQYA